MQIAALIFFAIIIAVLLLIISGFDHNPQVKPILKSACSSLSHASVDQVQCELGFYNASCSLERVVPWTLGPGEINSCLSCCLQFWIVRSAGMSAVQHGSRKTMVIHQDEFWATAFQSTGTGRQHVVGRIELKYEHVKHPLVTYMGSSDHGFRLLHESNSKRKYVFISPAGSDFIGQSGAHQVSRWASIARNLLSWFLLGPPGALKDGLVLQKNNKFRFIPAGTRSDFDIKRHISEIMTSNNNVHPARKSDFSDVHQNVKSIHQNSMTTTLNGTQRTIALYCIPIGSNVDHISLSPVMSSIRRLMRKNDPLSATITHENNSTTVAAKNDFIGTKHESKRNVYYQEKSVALPVIEEDYYENLLRSKFVMVVADECDSNLYDRWATWVAEAVVAGAIPIINSACPNAHKYYHGLKLHLLSPTLPIIEVDFNNISMVESLLINLEHIHNNMTAYSHLYDISPFYAPYWLDKIYPHEAVSRHISRGMTKYDMFKQHYLPQLLTHVAHKESTNSNQVQRTNRNGNANKEEGIGGKMRVFPSTSLDVEIVLPRCCETVTGDLSWITPLIQHQLHPNNKEYFNETNAFYGEDTSKNMQGLRVGVSVYYKCPWCLPVSLAAEWTSLTSEIAQSSVALEMIKDHGGVELLEDFPIPHTAERYFLLREVPSFDLVVNGKEASAYLNHIVRRYPTADFAAHTIFWHAQPTHHLTFERTARLFEYLNTCQPRSRSNQPSLQMMESKTSRKLIDMSPEKRSKRQKIVICSGSNTVDRGAYKKQQQISSAGTKGIEGDIDFMSLNYRWFEGIWAHQPEKCMLSLLKILYESNTSNGDKERWGAIKHLFDTGVSSTSPTNNGNVSTTSITPNVIHFDAAFVRRFFDEVPMASAVAAQFVVSKHAVLRRPYEFWQYLQALNNGSIAVPHCRPRDNLSGSEVASAMERLWHNFFRVPSPSEMKAIHGLVRSNSGAPQSTTSTPSPRQPRTASGGANNRQISPLYLPDIADDISLPKYLRTTPEDHTAVMAEAGQGQGNNRPFSMQQPHSNHPMMHNNNNKMTYRNTKMMDRKSHTTMSSTSTTDTMSSTSSTGTISSSSNNRNTPENNVISSTTAIEGSRIANTKRAGKTVITASARGGKINRINRFGG